MILLVAIMAISGTMIVRKNLRLKQEAQEFAAIPGCDVRDRNSPGDTAGTRKRRRGRGQADRTGLRTIRTTDCPSWNSIRTVSDTFPLRVRKFLTRSMQNEDNEYYLHRDMAGEKSVGGCIYMDSNHDIHEKGLHTIYGHHMRNGSMFRDVARFTDATYFAEPSEHHDPGFRSGSPFKTCILLCRQGGRLLSERLRKPRPGHRLYQVPYGA